VKNSVRQWYEACRSCLHRKRRNRVGMRPLNTLSNHSRPPCTWSLRLGYLTRDTPSIVT